LAVKIERALISVSDKTGVAKFAQALAARGAEIISTGGTAQLLVQNGVPVVDVCRYTGQPEIMDGRVKTLHPKIHGGILATRDSGEHCRAMEELGILPIDLVCANLYPFEATMRRFDCTLEEALERIDIGGPAMLRAAAKNHRYVTVACHPSHYDRIVADMDAHGGQTSQKLRAELALEVFKRTSAYDAAVATYLGAHHPELKA
jgi:phosphoribosylaminoimidazolecarboxamide formyltransferase/IMP cyclohydrolase